MSKKRILLLVASCAIVALAFLTSGCAGIIAGIDVDAALKVAADVNLANARTAAMDKSLTYERAASKLEDDLTVRLGKSTGGAQAVQILEGYRKAKAEQEQSRDRNMAQYAKMLDNAALIVQLINQRIALRARWDALLGRIPAVSHLKTLAEVEARQYMQTISKGAPQ